MNLFLSKVDSVIESNLHSSEFSIELICTEMAMSRSNLYRNIFGLTGKSIIGYISSFRLFKGMALIRQGEHNPGEIAVIVGYNDSHYFSRSFKKEFGRPPSSYMEGKGFPVVSNVLQGALKNIEY